MYTENNLQMNHVKIESTLFSGRHFLHILFIGEKITENIKQAFYQLSMV